ncbi:hypothetical protein ACJRO7_015570 [Eucalyptus globulus]|uniref:Uncharacterized protein n=1 Tax=Eucalyptus globulus TaxID=34317 RepID=A0ABD3L409_EUCGL
MRTSSERIGGERWRREEQREAASLGLRQRAERLGSGSGRGVRSPAGRWPEWHRRRSAGRDKTGTAAASSERKGCDPARVRLRGKAAMRKQRRRTRGGSASVAGETGAAAVK